MHRFHAIRIKCSLNIDNLSRILFFVDRFIDFAHSVVSYDAIIEVDDTANVFGGCVDVEIEYFTNE